MNPRQFFSNPQRTLQMLMNSGNPMYTMQNMVQMTGNPKMMQAFNQAKNMVENNPIEDLPQVAQNFANSNNINYDQFAQTTQQWGMPPMPVKTKVEKQE